VPAWFPVTNFISEINGRKQVSLAPLGQSAYFRLHP